MDDGRLDDLLARARESEPADDGFTQRVMGAIAADSRGLRRVRRFVARPALLAVAAVVLAGGAFAAVRTVTAPPSSTPAAAPVAEATPASDRAPAGAPPAAAASTPASTATSASPTPMAMRKHGAELGYTSDHTAYAIDRGVRLELETFVNELEVGRAHTVRATLENLTDSRVALAGREGCLVMVMAARDGGGRGEGTFRCVGRPLVLEPRSRVTYDVRITLEKAGEWGVFAQCTCWDDAVPQATPTQKPGLLDVSVAPPEPKSPRQPSGEGMRRLVTPPVRIRATA